MKRKIIIVVTCSLLGLLLIVATLIVRASNSESEENRKDALSVDELPFREARGESNHFQKTRSVAFVDSKVRSKKKVEHDHIVQSWHGTLEPTLKTIGESFERGEIKSFRFPLFDGEVADIEIKSYQVLGSSIGCITGKVVGQGLSHVVISHVNEAESGTIQMPQIGKYYEIRSHSDPLGSVIVSEIDISQVGECGVCNVNHQATDVAVRGN